MLNVAAFLGLGQDAVKREKAFRGSVSEDPQKTARWRRVFGGLTLNVCSGETSNIPRVTGVQENIFWEAFLLGDKQF